MLRTTRDMDLCALDPDRAEAIDLGTVSGWLSKLAQEGLSARSAARRTYSH